MKKGDLADLVGAHKNTVFLWLKGTKRPSYEKIEKLVSITGIDRNIWRYGDELDLKIAWCKFELAQLLAEKEAA